MALVKKRSNSARLVIIGAVVVLVAGLGYVLFTQFFLKAGERAANLNNTNRFKTVITNFGESILRDQRFTELRSFDVNISADANVDGGQINPFR